ncbi:hypothetical protein K9M59_01960 [Candidatus Gracilibacteria bacterium]|nr:hypothetical protein [Candidatus Gracilibacteria bacterium]MCF7819613.1 hypothetical protein [Candidatus Gracilibacteria bacterium]
MKKFFILGFSSIFLWACAEKKTDNLAQIDPTQNFTMEEELSCRILTSTDTRRVSEEFILTDLFTKKPQVVWTDEKVFYSLSILHDERNLKGLRARSQEEQFIDTFLLNTQTGIFAVQRVGPAYGEEGVISKGNCR